MTPSKIKTTPGKEVREWAVKREDEPLIAREREALEAELRLLGGKLDIVAVFDDERVVL
jgi:hypothetical protein